MSRATKACAFLVGIVLYAAPAGGGALAAEPNPKPPLVLADFERPDLVDLQTHGAEAKTVAANEGQALQVTTRDLKGWPGVYLSPRSGKWDLTGYDGVAVQVTNREAKPLRVVLMVNNPGADGQKNCNADTLEVEARSTITFTLPFGMWHGDPSHPLDLSRILSVYVCLENPGERHTFTIDNVRGVTIAEVNLKESLATPFLRELVPPFRHGINLGNALEAPREGDWGVKLEERYFAEIAAAGFDTIRLPVRWSAHAAKAAPYTIEPAFLARVDWAVEQALSRKLKLVLNVHHYDELMRHPEQERDRFLALWDQIATHYRARPAELFFEPLNEPQPPTTADQWNRLAADAIGVIRRTNPTRMLVVGPVNFNAISALPGLELPENDRQIVVTVHYYAPYLFTHQGAPGASDEAQKTAGRKWTGTQAEELAVRRDFDQALAWSVKHERPIFLGEFGANDKADIESRVRWTRFVAREAEQRKMGHAYWEFCSAFGTYDARRHEWVAPLRDALISAR